MLFLVLGAVQLLYYWVIYSRFAFHKNQAYSQNEIPVSVVICAKNEFTGLKHNLPLILNQDYPTFEVVVVNDASDDETIFLLEDLSREFEQLTTVTITEDLNFFRGKKFPLSLGIKSAKYEHLLLTDADCTPTGKTWITNMAAGFSDQKEVVLGYGKYEEKGGLLNRIVRYETAFTALQYFSLALWGSAYMGVGRNLAYRKKLFIENKGFIAHYNVASGDDDLFINEVATKRNTSIIYSPDGYTVSRPKQKFNEWWRQKRRHLTTGKYYKIKHKIILGGYSISYLLFLSLFIVLLALNIHPEIILAMFFARILSQLILFKFSFNKLNEKKLLLISPLIELIIAIIYPVMVSINLVYKDSRWK